MLTLDYANCLSTRVGPHGLDPARVHRDGRQAQGIAALTKQLNQSRGTGWERWRELWTQPMRSDHVSSINSIADKCRGKFDNLVVLGIGGSALGNIALQQRVAAEPTWNLLPKDDRRDGPQACSCVDNVDPASGPATRSISSRRLIRDSKTHACSTSSANPVRRPKRRRSSW